MDKKYTISQGNSRYGRKYIETPSSGKNQYERVQTQGPKKMEVTRGRTNQRETKAYENKKVEKPAEEEKEVINLSPKKTKENVTKDTSTKTEREVLKGDKGETIIVEKQIITTTKTITPVEEEQKKLRSKKKQARSRSVIRGDLENVKITHIIDTEDPNVDFHITDPLDFQYADRPSQLKALQKIAKKKKDVGKSTFNDSCANWKPSEKKKRLCSSVVHEHVNGKSLTRELEGTTEPTTKKVGLRKINTSYQNKNNVQGSTNYKKKK